MYYYNQQTKSNIEFDLLGKIPGSNRVYKAMLLKDGKLIEVGILSYYDDIYHKKAVDIYFAKKQEEKRIEFEQRRNSIY